MILIYLGDGAGKQSVGEEFPISPWVPSLSLLGPPLGLQWPSNSSLAVVDFYGDGKVDIDSTSYVVPGTGDGNFRLPVTFGQFSQGVTVLDVNGDGKPDLVGVGFAPDTISVLMNSTGDRDASVQAYLAAPGAPYGSSLPPGALAPIYGTDLTQDHSIETLALPFVFGNTSVEIVDAGHQRFLAPLLYVSPSQNQLRGAGGGGDRVRGDQRARHRSGQGRSFNDGPAGRPCILHV